MTTPPLVSHWYNGAEQASNSTQVLPVFDPARGIQTKNVVSAHQEDIEKVIRSAKTAFESWSETSLSKRQQVIFAFRELLNARKEELAAIITEEHGKVLSDALGEVTRGLEIVEFACGMPHLLKGDFSSNVSTSIDVYSTREP
ncbi:MAG: aldehyde dehydrogenase family protein, partial [Candidatus Nanopelagicales bacterium]